MPPHQSWKDTEDRIEALAARFQDGEFSETVYRASLFALRLRGDDIDHIVRRQMEIKLEQSHGKIRRPRREDRNEGGRCAFRS